MNFNVLQKDVVVTNESFTAQVEIKNIANSTKRGKSTDNCNALEKDVEVTNESFTAQDEKIFKNINYY